MNYLIQIHELDQGRRYASARVGSGADLQVYTTPISQAKASTHEANLRSKIRKLYKSGT